MPIRILKSLLSREIDDTSITPASINYEASQGHHRRNYSYVGWVLFHLLTTSKWL